MKIFVTNILRFITESVQKLSSDVEDSCSELLSSVEKVGVGARCVSQLIFLWCVLVK
jgi:hypothetical protein